MFIREGLVEKFQPAPFCVQIFALIIFYTVTIEIELPKEDKRGENMKGKNILSISIELILILSAMGHSEDLTEEILKKLRKVHQVDAMIEFCYNNLNSTEEELLEMAKVYGNT